MQQMNHFGSRISRNIPLTRSPLEQQAWANAAEAFTPPAWSCGYGEEQDLRAEKDVDRFLFEDVQDNDHHDFDHDDTQHDHSDHDHSNRFDPSSTEMALSDLRHSLRGSELRIGKHRRVQNQAFSYWVDIYVEIDRALCADNGETCANGIGPNTINYGEYR
jgi:hypothetical protein